MAAFKKYFSAQVGLAVFLAIFISSAGLVLAAWQPPQSSPPEGNPAPPLDTGSETQRKEGHLELGGILRLVNDDNEDTLRLNSDLGMINLYSGGNVGGSIYSTNGNNLVLKPGLGIGVARFNFSYDNNGFNPILSFNNSDAGIKYDAADGKLKFRNNNGEWSEFSIGTWSKNGANVFYNDGNVGIGLNAPAFPLDVNGAARISGAVSLATAGGRVGIGTASPSEAFQIGDRFTFHNGGTKIIGYNFKYEQNQARRIVEDETAIIGLTGAGEIVLRTAAAGAADSQINWNNGIFVKNDGKIGVNSIDPGSNLSVAGNLAVGQNYASQTAPINGAIFEGKINVGTDVIDSAGLFRVEGGDIYLANKVVRVGNQTIVKLRFYGSRQTRVEGQDISQFFDNEGSEYAINRTCQLANNGAFNDSNPNNPEGNINSEYTLRNVNVGTNCVDRFLDPNGISKVNLWKAVLIDNENPDVRGGLIHFYEDRNGTDFALGNYQGKFKLTASWSNKDLLGISQGDNKILYSFAADGTNIAPIRMHYVSAGDENEEIKQGEATGGYYPYAVYAP